VQQTLRLRDEHYRVASPPAAISVKGAASKVKSVKEKDTKGKGKAKPLEITLSSDDDEVEDEEEGPYDHGASWANGDDSDPVQDFDDEPKAGPSNPRMSQHQSISSSKSRQDALASRRNQEGQISSDYDELAMPLIDSLRRTGSRTGNVSSKVDHFEELANGARGGGNGGGAKGKMATSMGPRVSFSLFRVPQTDCKLIIDLLLVRFPSGRKESSTFDGRRRNWPRFVR
jgi:hypothetical protein